jgi:hypothetical protein
VKNNTADREIWAKIITIIIIIKLAPEQATKTQRGSKVIILLLL